MNEHQFLLGLVSNSAPATNLCRALEMLRQYVSVGEISTIWVTKSVGEAGPDYLNAAIRIYTTLKPNKLKMQVIRPIEDKLGRARTKRKNAARTIDIDIMIGDGQVFDDERS